MSRDYLTLDVAEALESAAGPRSFAARRVIGSEAIATACAGLFLFAMAAVGLAPERHGFDASGWELRGSLAGTAAR